jgi:hypothetical protein
MAGELSSHAIIGFGGVSEPGPEATGGAQLGLADAGTELPTPASKPPRPPVGSGMDAPGAHTVLPVVSAKQEGVPCKRLW